VTNSALGLARHLPAWGLNGDFNMEFLLLILLTVATVFCLTAISAFFKEYGIKVKLERKRAFEIQKRKEERKYETHAETSY
jgi:hypothetical protein